jgi:NTP pyrophosphatase (non-canonical NTP hydrolase)
MTQKEVMRKAIETYGEEAQLWMVAEEMSELQKEICKYKRGKKNQEEMTDEIADVLIMIEQLSIICGITIDSVRERIDYKIDRLEERLNATGDNGGLK